MRAQELEALPLVATIDVNIKGDGGMQKPQNAQPQDSKAAFALPAARKWLTLDSKVRLCR